MIFLKIGKTNNFFLGTSWSIYPIRTLYIPPPFLFLDQECETFQALDFLSSISVCWVSSPNIIRYSPDDILLDIIRR